MKKATITTIVLLLTLATIGLATADSISKPAVHPEMVSQPAREIISPTLRLLTILPQPSSEGEHALAYDPHQNLAWLYGGNRSGHPYNSDSWLFQTGAVSKTAPVSDSWQQLTPANQPAARYGAAAGFLNDRQLILFGGSDQNDTTLDQTWVYTNGEWLNLEPAYHPSARTYPAVANANDADALYLFGGNDGSVYHQDLWRYTAGSWSCLACAVSPKPPARTLSAMAFDPLGQRLWLFGGQDETGNPLADLWQFDLTDQRWQEISSHETQGGLESQTGAVSKTAPVWQQPSTRPTGRWAHSLTYDADNDALWLIGGTPDDEIILGESWLYQVGSWQLATTEPAVAYHQTVMLNDQRLLVVGQGQSWLYQPESSATTTNLVTNSGFETGTLVGWELPYPGITVESGSAYRGDYGVKLPGRGRIDDTFETIPGQSYQVSAWVRLDEVISPPSWGGLWIQVVDIPSWHQLGRSAYLHAGSHPTGQTLPLGDWHYVTFRFEAVGSTSRIVYQNFSDGELVASADEFQVLPLAEPSLLARSSRLLSRSYAVHLPVIRGGTGLSEAVLADRLLAWERAWVSGQRPDLPVELARVYGVGD